MHGARRTDAAHAAMTTTPRFESAFAPLVFENFSPRYAEASEIGDVAVGLLLCHALAACHSVVCCVFETFDRIDTVI